MMRSVVLAFVGLVPSFAAAQVVFEPVRYQYVGQRQVFYYGGTDPDVVARGLAVENLHQPCSASADECSPNTGVLRVYSDRQRGWNAALYGMTPSDARNEAYNSLPRYFRKGDLLPPADVRAEIRGAIVVPAQTQPMRVEPVAKAKSGAAVTKPSPILIIPKDALKQPLKAPTRKAMFVASAMP